MSVDQDNHGISIPESLADKYTDDPTGIWFLNRFLIGYCNSCEYEVTRADEKVMKFRRRIYEG